MSIPTLPSLFFRLVHSQSTRNVWKSWHLLLQNFRIAVTHIFLRLASRNKLPTSVPDMQHVRFSKFATKHSEKLFPQRGVLLFAWKSYHMVESLLLWTFRLPEIHGGQFGNNCKEFIFVNTIILRSFSAKIYGYENVHIHIHQSNMQTICRVNYCPMLERLKVGGLCIYYMCSLLLPKTNISVVPIRRP